MYLFVYVMTGYFFHSLFVYVCVSLGASFVRPSILYVCRYVVIYDLFLYFVRSLCICFFMVFACMCLCV